MFVWRKSVAEEWLRLNEPNLSAATAGRHAVIERPHHKKCLVEFFCPRFPKARELRARWGGSVARLPNNWERGFLKPRPATFIKIGKRLVVASDQSASGARILVVPAGTAFGTGEHVTTAMCLRLLEEVTRRWPDGWSLLDAGTGSGILALAAKRLGARQVLAIDIDPIAISTAKQNAQLNKLKIKFRLADIAAKNSLSDQRYDIISANLFSELLIRALSQWKRRLKRNGLLILSGVLKNQEPQVERALRRFRFAPLTVRRRGKWVAILASPG